MLNYIFFDASLRDRFADFVRERSAEVVISDEDGFVASISEDLDDDLSAEIDHCYEKLLQENAAMLEGTDAALEKNVAGVQVTLDDGSPCMIRLNPDLLARMLGCISLEELHDLVQSVASAVQNPDNRPLCHT